MAYAMKIISLKIVLIGFTNNCKTESCLNDRNKNVTLVHLRAFIHLRIFSKMRNTSAKQSMLLNKKQKYGTGKMFLI